MRVRRAIVVVMAALAMWTAVALLMVAQISHAPCGALAPIPPGGFPGGVVPTLTQAEMDARTAACNQPRPGDLVIPVLGYLLIVGFGVAYATVGKPQGSADQ